MERFHTSYMPIVAQGARALSCESGQSFIISGHWGRRAAVSTVTTAFAGLHPRPRRSASVVLNPSKHYYISSAAMDGPGHAMGACRLRRLYYRPQRQTCTVLCSVTVLVELEASPRQISAFVVEMIIRSTASTMPRVITTLSPTSLASVDSTFTLSLGWYVRRFCRTDDYEIRPTLVELPRRTPDPQTAASTHVRSPKIRSRDLTH